MYLAKSTWSWRHSTDAQNPVRQTADCRFATEASSGPHYAISLQRYLALKPIGRPAMLNVAGLCCLKLFWRNTDRLKGS
jgi:hypothetical protein